MSLAIALFVFSQALSDSARLKQAMPAIDLLGNQRLDKAFKPYVDCYVNQIKSNPANDLSNDALTKRMFETAFGQCEPERGVAEKLAADQIGPDSEREIATYRRVSIWSRLRSFFHARGDGQKFDAAFVRMFNGRQ